MKLTYSRPAARSRAGRRCVSLTLAPSRSQLTLRDAKIYSFDPFASLDDSQYSLVLGGEALLWSEQAGPENLDSIAW